ncbi:hypothetical protein T440DRAFT_469288 [Plenodomus tracheiphilus IPT5]|uniref:Carbohydrate-binding module family 19 domain-containing protein n=1 Tax=Plenodomus tracheiphilus IPT5 TaxID=1408161 RepID=A0A6A7B207_9PLEO|nr:hypothetical protein T440DRAFT_469288 [Plenodomus tracheiphilus IPT5]
MPNTKLITFLTALLSFAIVTVGTALPKNAGFDTASPCKDGETACAASRNQFLRCENGVWTLIPTCHDGKECNEQPLVQCIEGGAEPNDIPPDQHASTEARGDTEGTRSAIAARESLGPQVINIAIPANEGAATSDVHETVYDAEFKANGMELPCVTCARFRDSCLDQCVDGPGAPPTCYPYCRDVCLAKAIRYSASLGFTCKYFCRQAC